MWSHAARPRAAGIASVRGRVQGRAAGVGAVPEGTLESVTGDRKPLMLEPS